MNAGFGVRGSLRGALSAPQPRTEPRRGAATSALGPEPTDQPPHLHMTEHTQNCNPSHASPGFPGGSLRTCPVPPRSAGETKGQGAGLLHRAAAREGNSGLDSSWKGLRSMKRGSWPSETFQSPAEQPCPAVARLTLRQRSSHCLCRSSICSCSTIASSTSMCWLRSVFIV